MHSSIPHQKPPSPAKSIRIPISKQLVYALGITIMMSISILYPPREKKTWLLYALLCGSYAQLGVMKWLFHERPLQPHSLTIIGILRRILDTCLPLIFHDFFFFFSSKSGGFSVKPTNGRTLNVYIHMYKA